MTRTHSHLKKICITGGIGSGKSAFVRVLGQLGYPVFDADRLVDNVVLQPQVMQQIVTLLGEDSYLRDPQGERTYNRAWVRDQVFSDPSKRTRLEGIIHPALFLAFDEICKQIEINSGGVWVFYEAALIFESGRESQFNATVSVVADEPTRLQRLQRHRNLSNENVSAIIAAQVSDHVRRARSNFIIENNGSLDDLVLRATELTQALRQFFHPKSH